MSQSISSADNLSLLPTICLWCRLYICYADNLSVMATIHVLWYYLWCRQYICYAGNLSLMPTIHVLIRQSSFYAVTLIPCLYIWLPVCVYVWYMYKYPIQQEVWHELVGWDLPSSIFHPYDARAYKGLVGSNWWPTKLHPTNWWPSRLHPTKQRVLCGVGWVLDGLGLRIVEWLLKVLLQCVLQTNSNKFSASYRQNRTVRRTFERAYAHKSIRTRTRTQV